MSTFEVIRGAEGHCLVLDGTRIAGPKPWGGGRIIHEWRTEETYADAATAGADFALNTDGSYVCPVCGCVVDYDLRGDDERVIGMGDCAIPFNFCPKCGAEAVPDGR